jgi:hypothetical protein
VESQTDDSVIYRCNATNQFTKKIFRTLSAEVTIQSRPDNHRNDASSFSGLLPSLQSSTQKIKSGQILVLHCASHANKVSRDKSPGVKLTSDENDVTKLWHFTHKIIVLTLPFPLLFSAILHTQILWTFTPRTSNIPISLTIFNNELKYVNVSVTKHDGIYNCSTESDFQVSAFLPSIARRNQSASFDFNLRNFLCSFR